MARDLWSKGVAVDLLHTYTELESIEDILEWCRRTLVPHVVMVERSLLLSGKVKVRTVESGRTLVVGVAELPDHLHTRHHLERR